MTCFLIAKNISHMSFNSESTVNIETLISPASDVPCRCQVPHDDNSIQTSPMQKLDGLERFLFKLL
jgi:hypothetical protein